MRMANFFFCILQRAIHTATSSTRNLKEIMKKINGNYEDIEVLGADSDGGIDPQPESDSKCHVLKIGMRSGLLET